MKGDRKARTVMIEYSDFQCSYCATFARDTLPRLTKEYIDTGKLLFAFRHLPLEGIHPHAVKAAEAAECSGRQTKFWEMHDVLFRDPKALSEDYLVKYAEALGLNVAHFRACLAGQTASKVEQDAASARRAGVTETPTFFVAVHSNGSIKVTKRLSGAQRFPDLKQVLDQHLAILQPANQEP